MPTLRLMAAMILCAAVVSHGAQSARELEEFARFNAADVLYGISRPNGQVVAARLRSRGSK